MARASNFNDIECRCTNCDTILCTSDKLRLDTGGKWPIILNFACHGREKISARGHPKKEKREMGFKKAVCKSCNHDLGNIKGNDTLLKTGHLKGKYKTIKNEEKVSFFLDNEPITPEEWREKYNKQKSKARKKNRKKNKKSKANNVNAEKSEAKKEDDTMKQLQALAINDPTLVPVLEKLKRKMKGAAKKKVSATSQKIKVSAKNKDNDFFLNICPPVEDIMLSKKNKRGFKAWLEQQTSMVFIMSYKEIKAWISKFALSKHHEDIKVLLNMLLLEYNTRESNEAITLVLDQPGFIRGLKRSVESNSEFWKCEGNNKLLLRFLYRIVTFFLECRSNDDVKNIIEFLLKQDGENHELIAINDSLTTPVDISVCNTHSKAGYGKKTYLPWPDFGSQRHANDYPSIQDVKLNPAKGQFIMAESCNTNATPFLPTMDSVTTASHYREVLFRLLYEDANGIIQKNSKYSKT